MKCDTNIVSVCHVSFIPQVTQKMLPTSAFDESVLTVEYQGKTRGWKQIKLGMYSVFPFPLFSRG